MHEVTKYNEHFLALGNAHGLVIYNSLLQWPKSDAITCWNPKGGANTFGYLMGSPLLLPEITNFAISSRPIGSAADLVRLHFQVWMDAKRMHAKYQFTPEIEDVKYI
jgi:hypothetical protein